MSFISDYPTVFAVVGIVVVVAILVFIVAKRYKIPAANEALVITGSKGKQEGTGPSLKVVIGSGAFIMPFVQRVRTLALDATEIPMQVPEGVSKDNIKVIIEAVALAKIDGTPDGVRAAAQRFLGRESEIPGIVTSILAGALRGVAGNMSIDEMLRDREGLAAKIQEAAGQALSDAGLRVDTLQINGIATDPPDYITNLGRPQAAQVRKAAEIAEAENEREAAEAKAKARIAIAAANKEAQLREADFLKETAKAEAEAAAVGPKTKAAQDAEITQAEQANASQQVELTRLRLDSEVRARADADLYAAQKAADAGLYTAEQEAKARAVAVTAAAEAEKKRLTNEGEGQAAAILAQARAEQARLSQEGKGEAEAIEARGLAQARAIKAQGEAEAQVKELLAAAYEKYGQQAVIDRVLAALPEMLAAVAKPIGDIDSITVLGGADQASGVTKLGTDLLVQLPALVKATTGLDLNQLFAQWFTDKLTPAGTPSGPVPVATPPVTPATPAE
ncbi:MAG: hypothetical protein LBR27_07160 [Bifidobacteriaceae bacterium]|jgi:flotillin|nr:hypothetical protein [Bifidobacteriaceae bacterium]